MKARITFIHDAASAGNALDATKQISTKSKSVELYGLQASIREDHITIGVDELPKDLWDRALRDSNALHIRWQSPRQFEGPDPFSSRVAPGLHIYYTPTQNQTDVICYALQSEAASEACKKLTKSVQNADVVDIDYTAISNTVTVRVIQYSPSKIEKETIHALESGKIEIGILSLEDSAPGSTEGEDAAVKLSLGGLVTVIGEDDKPSPVLFSFPSRHHSSSTRYAVSFNKPTGLHPTMRISFPNGTPKPPAGTSKANKKDADVESEGRQCALHAFLSLPNKIFPDKYQLAAPNFLAANNLRSLRSLTDPPPDLEAPDWAVDAWGSNMLVELAPPSAHGSSWDAQIPLHLRYQKPAPGGQAITDVPWPSVFWACTSSDGSKMGVNPFDREHLGYDGAFGPRTVYYHLTADRGANTTLTGPSGSSPVTMRGLIPHARGEEAEILLERINVPVLDTEGWAYEYLRTGTAAVMLLGLLWVAWKLVYVTITNREAGAITKMAQRERVEGEGKEVKKDR